MPGCSPARRDGQRCRGSLRFTTSRGVIMASAVRWTEQPVFRLMDVPEGNSRMVLTPALRWRVVLEQTRHVEHDVIQEAVLRLHAAGERTADRVADRLQLPEELIRH